MSLCAAMKSRAARSWDTPFTAVGAIGSSASIRSGVPLSGSSSTIHGEPVSRSSCAAGDIGAGSSSEVHA